MLIPRLKRLDGSLVPQYCATAESIVSNECPSSEWESLAAFELIVNNSVPSAEYLNYHRQWLPYATQLTGRNSMRQFITTAMSDSRPGPNPLLVFSSTQQSVIADALTNTAVLWDLALVNATSGSTHGSPFSDQRAATHAVKHDYYQPYTVASCSGKMYLNITEGSPITFPINFESDGPGNSTIPIDNHNKLHANGTEFYGISPTQILETPRSSYRDYGLKWVELPKNAFNDFTIGAIVLLPRKTANSSQLLYTCTLSSGWGNSSLKTSTGFAIEPVLSQVYVPMNDQERGVNDGFSNFHMSEFEQSVALTTGLFNEPYYPEKPITITPDWADYLNPFIPSINTTTFNVLMSIDRSAFSSNNRAAFMLVGLVTNGLARVGFKNRLQGSLKTVRNPKTNDTELDGNYWISGKGDVFEVDPIESKDWVKFLVESGLQGYAYNTTGAAPKVAIVFLLTYIVFALSHVLYAGFSGTTPPPPPSVSGGVEQLSLSIVLIRLQASVPHPGIPSPKSPL